VRSATAFRAATWCAPSLLAFVVRRLARSRAARALAIPVAIAVIVLMVFDRLYLDVHWESDVIGGLLLGAIGLVAATVWLDRPRKAEN
jgi:undecaprenyl-diphosphatase